MSYGLTPIAVDLESVRAAIGSKDKRLFRTLALEMRHRIADLDRMDDPDADEEDRPITALVALNQIIMGGPVSKPRLNAAKYGYMFEGICRHFGEDLPNSEWSAMRGDWFDTVDAALGAAGVPADGFRTVGRLIHRRVPVAIPGPDDFPAIGHLLRGEMAPARAELSGLELPDREVRKSIDQVRAWLAKCEATGRDLVCFYY